MKFIELHIKCRNNPDNADELRELGVEEQTEYRLLYLKVDSIDAMYPDKEGGCFIFVGGDELTVKESYQKIKAIIDAS